MKRAVIQRLNAFLASLIVVLGFNACHTVKTAEGDKGDKGKTEKTENSNPPVVPQQGPTIREPQPVVYGPPPSDYNKKP